MCFQGTTFAGKRPIVLVGQGALHEAVSLLLAADVPLLSLDIEHLETTPPDSALLVYCSDRSCPQHEGEINAYALKQGIPWLRANTEFGAGIVGPYVAPGTPGCLACAESRRRAASPNAGDVAKLNVCAGMSEVPHSQPWLSVLSVDVLARLIAQEVHAALHDATMLRTSNALLYVALETLRVSRHRYLPDPQCPDCGHRPDDSAESAAITLHPRPKLASDTYRVRDLTALADKLLDTYVDTEAGLIHAIGKLADTPGASVSASLGIDYGSRQRRIPGFGRTLSYQASMVAAIAEALERYGGHVPRGKRTTVHASYAELGDTALNPETLGLHTPAQYALPEYEFVPFTPDTICNWVWGYSFGRQRPILVPEHYAYYGLPPEPLEAHNPAFAYEISSGCALGNCLEEAIFYGILELAERDAFLITWYARLSLPRLDLSSAREPTVKLLADQITSTSGYTLYAYDATLDHAIPCIWLLAVDEQDRQDMPKALCGAGSHPHPEHALANALEETAAALVAAPARFARERERAREMFADSSVVKEMMDHTLLYDLPEAFERLSFLSTTQPTHPFDEVFAHCYDRPPTMDLRDDLIALIDHYLARAIDVIVVDQTSAEHRLHDFSCVKVIMPGLLPMTFGHQHQRTVGFKRLSQLPYALGYWSHPLTETDINPFPHPFP